MDVRCLATLLLLPLACAAAAAAAGTGSTSAGDNACGLDCRAHSLPDFKQCLRGISPPGQAVFPEDGDVFDLARRWGTIATKLMMLHRRPALPWLLRHTRQVGMMQRCGLLLF